MKTLTDYELAEARVNQDSEMLRLQSIILHSEWTEEDHYDWVATAPREDILKWALEIDRNCFHEAQYREGGQE